jgi:hypothetical protein
MSPPAAVFALVALLCGCASTSDRDYPADLSSGSYIRRTQALGELGQRQDAANAEHAFALLRDQEITVRTLAHDALRDLSAGEDFGYRADLEEGDRIRVARRWQYWWEQGRG